MTSTFWKQGWCWKLNCRSTFGSLVGQLSVRMHLENVHLTVYCSVACLYLMHLWLHKRQILSTKSLLRKRQNQEANLEPDVWKRKLLLSVSRGQEWTDLCVLILVEQQWFMLQSSVYCCPKTIKKTLASWLNSTPPCWDSFSLMHHTWINLPVDIIQHNTRFPPVSAATFDRNRKKSRCILKQYINKACFRLVFVL